MENEYVEYGDDWYYFIVLPALIVTSGVRVALRTVDYAPKSSNNVIPGLGISREQWR
jgi:hypothetical protein